MTDKECRDVSLSLFVLLPDPFRGMEEWRKTMETQKPGNSPGPGPEIVERPESPKSKRRKESLAGQCRII